MQFSDMVSFTFYNFKVTDAIYIVSVVICGLVLARKINIFIDKAKNHRTSKVKYAQNYTLKIFTCLETLKWVQLSKKCHTQLEFMIFSGFLTWMTILCFDQQVTSIDELFSVHAVHQDKFHFRLGSSQTHNSRDLHDSYGMSHTTIA